MRNSSPLGAFVLLVCRVGVYFIANVGVIALRFRRIIRVDFLFSFIRALTFRLALRVSLGGGCCGCFECSQLAANNGGDIQYQVVQ